MSYPIHTRAIIGYIEAHIREGKPDYKELERRMGFSYAHIRDFFKKHTGISLGQYVRDRQLLASAFDLLHTDKSVMELALTYGFSNHESYTRAFKKTIGMTPSAFRKERPIVGKAELAEGIYGVGLLSGKERRSDVEMSQKEKYQNSDSTILYGVPKVAGFAAWARMLSEDSAFSGENESLMYERLSCQDDATACLIDGRGCAAEYFKRLSEEETGKVDAETLERYKDLAELFAKEKRLAEQTWSLLSGWDNMEQRPAKLAKKEVRVQACKYIREIEALEKKCLEILTELCE